MKGSHGIKKLYGSAGRRYGGGGRICPKFSLSPNKPTGSRPLCIRRRIHFKREKKEKLKKTRFTFTKHEKEFRF